MVITRVFKTGRGALSRQAPKDRKQDGVCRGPRGSGSGELLGRELQFGKTRRAVDVVVVHVLHATRLDPLKW